MAVFKFSVLFSWTFFILLVGTWVVSWVIQWWNNWPLRTWESCVSLSCIPYSRNLEKRLGMYNLLKYQRTTCVAVVSLYRFYSSSKVKIENLRIWYFATCLYLTIDLVLNYFYGYFKLVKSLEIYTQKSKPGWVILNLIEFNAILGKLMIFGLRGVVLYSLYFDF